MAIWIDDITKQKLLDINIEDVARELGINVSRHIALCFMHDDHHPSLHFWPKSNTWKCFVCDIGGNNISLVQQKLNLSFVDSCVWLADRFNILIPDSPNISSIESKIIVREPIKKNTQIEDKRTTDIEILEYLIKNLYLTETGKHFLFQDRHYDPSVIKTLRICSADNDEQIMRILNAKFTMQRLKESGMIRLTNEGVKPYFNTPCVFFPYYNGEGELQTIQARYLGNPDSHPRFQFPLGSKTCAFNLQILKSLKDNEILYISEGVTDCIALLSSGNKAIAVPSASTLNALAIKDVVKHPIMMFPDKDEPGEKLFLKLANKIQDAGGYITRRELPGGCKDYSDYYLLNYKPTEDKDTRGQLAFDHRKALMNHIIGAFTDLLYRTSNEVEADIVKRYIDGFNLQEISEEFNRSTDAIKAIIRNAMTSISDFSIAETPEYIALKDQNFDLVERIWQHKDKIKELKHKLDNQEEQESEDIFENHEEIEEMEDIESEDSETIDNDTYVVVSDSDKENEDILIMNSKATKRLKGILRNRGFQTLGDLCRTTPTKLLTFSAIGHNTVAQIERLLSKYNLGLSKVEEDGSPVEYNRPKVSEPENHWKRWLEDDDQTLCQLYQQGISIKEISHLYGRTYFGIVARLRKLGLEIE